MVVFPPSLIPADAVFSPPPLLRPHESVQRSLQIPLGAKGTGWAPRGPPTGARRSAAARYRPMVGEGQQASDVIASDEERASRNTQAG